MTGSVRDSATTTVAALATMLTLALAPAGTADAYQAAPGWTASDYVTGFPHPANAAGPVGLAFDASGNLLVANSPDGALHKAPPGGGTAAGTRIRDGYGGATGLAFDKAARLYMARGLRHDVVELDPATGEVIRTVVGGLPCPIGLAADPVSGDLFVSNVFCPGGGIMRIRGFANGRGTASRYAGGQDADGLTFAPDGTLYAAAGDRIVRITGTNTANPGAAATVVRLPDVDGIAYAPASTRDGAYLIVVRTDGEIDRVDLDGGVTPVLTGGSRGDLATVGPDHCVYADLQDRVIKLGPSTGSCAFALQDVLGERAADRMVDTAVRARASKSIRRGRRFDLKLTVSNKSAVNLAHRVAVSDTLPKGVKFVKVRAARGVKCTRRGRKVTCRRSSLAAGRSFSVALRVRSVSGKRYTNTARVKSKDLDPVPGNNTSRSRTKVNRG